MKNLGFRTERKEGKFEVYESVIDPFINLARSKTK